MPEISMSNVIAPVSLAEETANEIQDLIKSMDYGETTEDIIETYFSSDDNSNNGSEELGHNDIEEFNHESVSEISNIKSELSLKLSALDIQEKQLNQECEKSGKLRHQVKYAERKKRNKVVYNNEGTGQSGPNYESRQGSAISCSNSNFKERSAKKRSKAKISKAMLEELSDEQYKKITNELIDCYDARVYHPIRASQHEDEVNVPIMSPPPTETEPKYNFNEFRANYCRTLAAQFLEGKDIKACTFSCTKSEQLLDSFSFPSNNTGKPECICSSQNIFDDSLSGWEAPPKLTKTKSSKRRKSSRVSSETAFSRLTGQLMIDREDSFSFQHFKDSRKHIEHYRFFNTVGEVCQRPTTTKSNLSRGNMENEAYYSKLRSAFCAMASSFDLRTMLQDRDNASSSSSERNGKNKSDDESVEDPNSDKTLSMKDRGKTLNLAPVRECSVPDLMQADNFDQYQQNYATINQYLNLMTPPLSEQCLQLAYVAAKARRQGKTFPGGGDPLFPVSNQRRGVTPLRLGSAEFVKPGTPEQFAPPENRWSSEKKVGLQRSSTFHNTGSTVPGMLYVGSTVTTSPAQQGRIKSGGTPTSYHLHQAHHHLQHQSRESPHQICGKKFKPCERVNELSKDRGRGREEKVAPQYRAGVEPRDNYARSKDRLISVNVNHLGIRGRTFKAEELSVFYKFDKDKNRRVATLTSNI